MPRILRIYLIAIAASGLIAVASVYVEPNFASYLILFPAANLLSTFTAALLILLFGLARRESLPCHTQWLAILALLAPQTTLRVVALFPSIRGMLGSWGDDLLMSLASPLWLALLIALQFVKAEISRTIVATSIIGLGAVCLTLPLNSYVFAPVQTVGIAIQLLAAILTVCAWSYASKQLTASSPILPAGIYLLLQSIEIAITTPSLMARSSMLNDWHVIALAIVLSGAITGAGILVWFWLLTRVSIAAFTLHPLALWIASTVVALALFGWNNWRTDIAVLIALAALFVGLRARTKDEQPIALELT